MVDHILRGVRQLSLDLRPSLLDDLGLAAALRWYVGAQAERSGIAGDVVTEDVPADLPRRHRHHLLPDRPGGRDQRHPACAGHADHRDPPDPPRISWRSA